MFIVVITAIKLTLISNYLLIVGVFNILFSKIIVLLS
jgi:hypothetical protein